MHSIEIRLFFIRSSLMRVGKPVQSFSYVPSLFSFIYGKATAFTQPYSRKNTETRRIHPRLREYYQKKLNNIDNISMDEAYATICGITEEEMCTQIDADLDTIRSRLKLTT